MPEKSSDRLSALIRRFRIDARVIAIGGDEARHDEVPAPFPNFFIIRRGGLGLSGVDRVDLQDDMPALIYFPLNAPAGLNVRATGHDTEYLAAWIDTGGAANPIALALPEVVTVPLDTVASLRAVTDILFEEALEPRCGGRTVIDRLCEIVVIRLLRHLIEAGTTEPGLVAGLAHPNLSPAIVAMHDNPERDWDLEDLAELSAMSRSYFVNTFRDVVGITPGKYLSNWRLTLARMELAKGTPLKKVVGQVGFSSPAALSRAFKRRYGISPRQDSARLAGLDHLVHP